MPLPGSPLAWLLVAFGGALGAVARYAAGLMLSPERIPQAVPYATLAVNVLGSALLGWLFVQVFLSSDSRQHSMWLLWGVGFCGAFTTMSTLSLETVTMLQSHQYGLAVLNWGLQTVACLGAVWLGLTLATR